jgi:alpha-galactosidase
LDNRTHEHSSYIIEALETGRIYRGHFIVINHNHITNLPNGCVIEIPGYVDRNGINMPVYGALPLACAATCSASIRVQEMAVEAAFRGDVMLLKQAMLHDPLTGAVCNPPEVWQMVDEMIVPVLNGCRNMRIILKRLRNLRPHKIRRSARTLRPA